MKLAEYQKVENLNYLQYCDYLQQKYGIGLCDYMTVNWNKNKNVTRTKEGLVTHHKYEDHAVNLSNPKYAMENPFEWQLAKNLVYCDYLEHLFLHILICEYSFENQNEFRPVGGAGIVAFLVPELNDWYSGFAVREAWKQNCYNLIIKDKKVYLTLLKRFKDCYPSLPEAFLYTSFNEEFGLWSRKQNKKLFEEIAAL